MATADLEPDRCCPLHGAGCYNDSLTCKICRPIIKKWLLWAAEQLSPIDIAAVAFRGSSGSAFGYWLADELGVMPVAVLKPDERGHGTKVRDHGLPLDARYIIVDDFVGSGETLRAVVSGMCTSRKCVGALLYMPGSSSARFDFPAVYKQAGVVLPQSQPPMPPPANITTLRTWQPEEPCDIISF